MDLIITANTKAEVSLHRSLDLQTVWTKSSPVCEVERVEKLAWRPDGQAVAIAYSYNKYISSDECSILKSLLLVVTIENEELSSLTIDGVVTCLSWCESKITSTVLSECTNYFPQPTPLPGISCVGVDDLKKSKQLLKENNSRIIDFLVIGTSTGGLKVAVGGFLSCGSLNISSFLGVEKICIRSIVLGSDMKCMFVLIEESVNRFTLTERSAQVLVLDTSVLSSKTAEITLLKTRIGQILILVDRIVQVQSCVTEVWECLKVAEIASNFSKYDVHFDSIESMAADFCELITFGVLSSSLERFLLQNLDCNCVKNIIQSVKDNCSNFETLISTHLNPFLEELMIILGEMTGMAKLERFMILGISNSLLSIASNNVRILILKAAEFYMAVQSLEKSYTAFYQWVSLVIAQLNRGESHVLSFSNGFIENSLPPITDYLNGICQLSHSYDAPISLFQHLGQYFEDICLSKPLEPHKWQTLLENRDDLVTVAGFIPASRKLTLAQAFQGVYDSISAICSAPEKAISPLFSVKNVIDLPETLSDCPIVKSCYFTKDLTLMSVFVNDKNTGEFSLVQVLPHRQNAIKAQKVLRLGNENRYKCLTVKWCPNETMFALFEEREFSCMYLVQIEKSVLDKLTSDCINLNAIQDHINVWTFTYLSVSCFAVSCKRKFGVAVNKNKIKTFDIGFDEDSLEKD